MRRLLLLLPFLLLTACGAKEANNVVTVYKTPTCGCCKAWVSHMEENGFTVKAVDMPNVQPMRQKLGVMNHMSSCHTAVVNGYVIEGHVPADDVKRLLAEKPDIVGLAVPGMPTGSPGMEVPGRPAERFNVLAFDKSGQRTVFSTQNGE